MENTGSENSSVGFVGLKMFSDPVEGFEMLSRRPKFIAMTLFIAICVMLLSGAVIGTVGFETIVEKQITNSPQLAELSREEKQEIIAAQSSPVLMYISIAVGGLATFGMMLLGGLYYWFSMNALGGKVRFPHGVAVFAYSSLPSTVLLVIANLIVLAVKPLDEITALAGRSSGLVQANLSVVLDTDASPALRALLESLDFFALIGWVLAVIGIKVVGKLTTGSAVGIVALSALFGIALRVGGMALFG